MIKYPSHGNYGSFCIGYHFGKPMIVNSYQENIRVYDMETLKDVAKFTFKNPIIHVLLPRKKKILRLEFVLITEDQMAHLIILTERGISIISSVDIQQSAQLIYCLLYDKYVHSFLLSEKGILISVSKQKVEKKTLAWPPKTMEKIKGFYPSKKFAAQKALAPNSAALLAFHFMGGNALISSWIYNFDTNEMLNGPFTIQTTPYSFFLTQKFFLADNNVYSIDPYKQIGTMENVVLASSTYCDTCTIVNEKGQIFRISENEIKQIGSVLDPILRIEGTDTDFSYITIKGSLITDSTKAELNFLPRFDLGHYYGIYAFPGYPNVSFRNIEKPSPLPETSLVNTIDAITSKGGAKWNAPSRITSHSFLRIDNEDYFIASTTLTVTIMKCPIKNGTFDIILDNNWDNPVSAVALNSHLYAVADATLKVTIQQYSGEPYNFTFSSSLCVSLSLSETTVAAGFADGSFIISSLKEKETILTIKPFRVPVKLVQHISNDKVSVTWGETTAEVSPNSFIITNIPSYPAAQALTFDNGLLTLIHSNSVDIYSFADKYLLGTIPMQVISIDTCKRRIAALTMKHELLILYFHRTLAVETQAIVDLVDPISIHISASCVYVVCKRCAVVFDYAGKKLDTIEFNSQPRCASASEGGLFVGFIRYFWFIGKDQKVKKLAHDKSNLQIMSAVDDENIVIATSVRALLCNIPSNNYITLGRFEKRLLSMRCIRSRGSNRKDKVATYFIDDAMAVWDIPEKQ